AAAVARRARSEAAQRRHASRRGGAFHPADYPSPLGGVLDLRLRGSPRSPRLARVVATPRAHRADPARSPPRGAAAGGPGRDGSPGVGGAPPDPHRQPPLPRRLPAGGARTAAHDRAGADVEPLPGGGGPHRPLLPAAADALLRGAATAGAGR